MVDVCYYDAFDYSIFWEYALNVVVDEIVYVHCHQQGKYNFGEFPHVFFELIMHFFLWFALILYLLLIIFSKSVITGVLSARHPS